MQALFDVLPVIVFFVVYSFSGIYAATVATMAVTALQIAYQFFTQRKVSKMLLTSGIAVGILGGLTLVVRNPLFIQWKPTVVYWLCAGAFLGSELIGGKTLVERAMGHVIELEPTLWRRLNRIWGATFVVLGATNLYIVYHFSQKFWVYSKLGMLVFLVLFAVAQAFWISARAAPAEPTSEK